MPAWTYDLPGNPHRLQLILADAVLAKINFIAIMDAIRNRDEALALTGDHLAASYARVSRSYAQHASEQEPSTA